MIQYTHDEQKMAATELAFIVCNEWGHIPHHEREYIIERLHGSRGLFRAICNEANLFTDYWNQLPDDAPERYDYIEAIEQWGMSLVGRLRAL